MKTIKTYLTIEHFHSVVVDAVKITDSHKGLLTNTTYLPVVTELKTRVTVYSDTYKRLKPESELGKKDSERDNIFLLLLSMAKAYARYSGAKANIGAQGKRLLRMILNYTSRLVYKGQQIETGDLTSLLNDIKAGFDDTQFGLMPGVKDAVEELEKANDAFTSAFQNSIVYQANLTPCATALTKDLRDYINRIFLPIVASLALYADEEFKALDNELSTMIDRANKAAWARVKQMQKEREEAKKEQSGDAKPSDGKTPDEGVQTTDPDAEIKTPTGSGSGNDPQDPDSDESRPMI